MSVPLSDVVFAFDMSVFSSGGNTYVRDFGPSGFHMRFGAGAASPVPQLDASLLFSGAQFAYYDGDLSRFYAAMPTRECTFLFYEQSVSRATFNTIFSNYTTAGGFNYGYDFRTSNGAAPECYCYRGDATGPRVQCLNIYQGNSRLYVTAMTIETATRWLADQRSVTSVWAGGAFGTVVHDQTIVPRIGSIPSGGLFFNGRIRHLSLIRGAVSSPDLAQLSRLIAEGVKPFCVRQ